MSREQKQFDGKIAKPGNSLAMFKDSPGWKGLCQERWKTWLDRLVPLNETEMTPETRSLFSQALGHVSIV